MSILIAVYINLKHNLYLFKYVFMLILLIISDIMFVHAQLIAGSYS